MSTDQIVFHETDVEVELHELLDWAHDNEAFVDLLRDKIVEHIEGGENYEGIDPADPDYPTTVFVNEYSITSNPRPNVVQFTVTWEIDA
jgi:hypothetical protein